MPRIYVTPGQFYSHPAAVTFDFQIQQLTARAGMDALMARASRRVDAYAKKRLVSAPATTIASPGIAAGQTLLPVASTLGLDNGAEEAVIIGSGGNQEVIAVEPGGINVTNWAYPYPGSIQLASVVTYNHNAGEVIQGCYQEVSTVGSSSSNDPLEQTWVQFDQGAQVAAAHAPYYGTGMLTRVIFLKCYPIQSVLKLEHMLPFTSEFGPIDISKLGIQIKAGYIRLQLGSFVLPDGLVRTTYQAGFSNVPDDIALATAYYAADELQMLKNEGAVETQRGKVKMKYLNTTETRSRWATMAENIIDSGNYRRKGP